MIYIGADKLINIIRWHKEVARDDDWRYRLAHDQIIELVENQKNSVDSIEISELTSTDDS